MASFKLDTSKLGGNRFQTVHATIDSGIFRDIQIELTQGGLGQDMEVHYIELHLTNHGVTKESL